MASTYEAKNAEGYERVMGRFSHRLSPLFCAFAGHAPAERLLDVGCGTGQSSRALAAGGDHAEIVGVDISATYIDFARSRNSDARMSFHTADACKLPFAAARFDRAISQLVLQFMPEPRLAVAEMRRVVRPRGVVAACVWDSFGAQPPMRMMWDVAVGLGLVDQPKLMRPMSTEGELSALWRAERFEDVTEELLTIRFAYDDFEDLWTSFADGDGPPRQFITGLSADRRDAFKARLKLAYLSGAPDGPRTFLGGAFACRGIVPGR